MIYQKNNQKPKSKDKKEWKQNKTKHREEYPRLVFLLLLFSHWVMFNSLQLHGRQHARLPCLSLSPGVSSTHVLWVGVSITISSCHPLICLPSTFPNIKAFSSVRASALTSVLPMHMQHWFPLGVTSLIPMLSKGLIRVFYSTTFQTYFSSVLRLLYGPILTIIHNYWKNHSFDNTDLCQQSDVTAF